MNIDNCVVFKGIGKDIVLILSETVSFEDIKETLNKKIEASSKFFSGVTTSITLKGRELSENEEKEIIDIISEKGNINISFLKTDTDISSSKNIINTNMPNCSFTKYHKGSIRSGQVLEFEGSIVIIGDINPGAMVKATGNITVLGQLKGIAHAGCNGDKKAFVSAIYMVPVQLRIADIITVFPDENIHGEKPAELAYIEDGQIYVRPLN